MESVTVDLEHCYGIAALHHTFSFAKKRQNVVYAPNSIMKSSLALTHTDRALPGRWRWISAARSSIWRSPRLRTSDRMEATERSGLGR